MRRLSLSLTLLGVAAALSHAACGASGGTDGGGAGGDTDGGGASSGTDGGGAGGAGADAGDGAAGSGGSGGCSGGSDAGTVGEVLHYTCEELAGPTAFDSSTYANNSTATGGVYFNKAGKLCLGIGFDGTGFLDAGKPASLSNLAAVTVEAWVRRNGGVGTGYSSGVVAKTAGNGDFDFSLGIRSDGALYWGSASADEKYGYRALLSQAGDIGFGSWVHVAGSYDVSKNERRFYLNGTELAPSSDSFGADVAAPMNGSGPVRVGNYVWAGANVDFLIGAVDEVRIWNTARTPGQICADAGGTFSGSTCTL